MKKFQCENEAKENKINVYTLPCMVLTCYNIHGIVKLDMIKEYG